MSPPYVPLLCTFIAAAQKQNDGCAVPGVVHAISATRVDPQLADAAPDTLPIAEEPSAESIQARNHTSAQGHIIHAAEPLSDRRPAIDSLILPNFQRFPSVA
jgi:hypothetical protein